MAVRVLLTSDTPSFAKWREMVQGRNALESDDWKAAEKAFIDALWVDEAANAVNAISWIGLCKVWRLYSQRKDTASTSAVVHDLPVALLLHAINLVAFVRQLSLLHTQAQLELPNNAEALRACNAAVDMNRDDAECRVLKVQALTATLQV